MDFKSGKELLELCKEHGISISEVMIQRETDLTEVSREAVLKRMGKALDIMRESSHKPLKEPVKSIGGLIGGEAEKFRKAALVRSFHLRKCAGKGDHLRYGRTGSEHFHGLNRCGAYGRFFRNCARASAGASGGVRTDG